MMKQKLPKNWIVLNSKTHPGRVYYFNVKTNQSSWEEPTVDQPEQGTKKSVESPRKHKKLVPKSDVKQNVPKTPEYNASAKEINTRKKLIAKRSVRQTQETTNKEKETPQMRAIRDKMLKRQEKNDSKSQSSKHSKNIVKSLSSKSAKSCSLISMPEHNTNPNITYTPQMQVVLHKMQDRASKGISKIKEVEECKKKNMKNKQEESIKCQRQLRSQGVTKEEHKSSKIAVMEKSITKKKANDHSSVEVISVKRSRKSYKKNLGNERMEKLRKSLTLQNSNNESSDGTSHLFHTTISRELPNIYKNAEVRLIRLKDRLLKNKSPTNKNLSNDQIGKTGKSSKKSTTVDDLVQQSHEDSFYEEMDWEPMEDDKITVEVQAIRTQLCMEDPKNILCSVSNNVLSSSPLLGQKEKKQLYIIVDTNVFLSNTEAVELAKETIFKTYNRPLIVIPWTVIRELDYIKDDNGKTKSGTLCMKARKAISYINKLFTSKHPRIIGQTLEDVVKNKEKFSADCPDDEILQLCLQIRSLEKSVVLLSYDVNLCNKAMIYDIETLGRNDPLEKVDYLNAVNSVDIASRSLHELSKERFSLDSISILSVERRLSDEIYDDVKSIIKDFLTVIVSKEMHDLYGESWNKYVIIKPPWTVVAVLQCAIKHWIAAVSESFLRKAEPILKELLEIFKNISGEKTLKEVGYTLNKCSDLIQMVNVDKYSDLMCRASQKIDELRQKYYNSKFQINEQKLRDVIGVENDVVDRERRAEKAFMYFEAAYIFARDMCGLAAEAVGMPCSFHYSIPNPLPTRDYLKQIQPELAANVNKLLHTLSAVIEQVKDSCVDHRTLTNLYQTLITFLPESAPMAMKLSNSDLAPLDVYCCVKQKEEVLKTGIRQLQDLSTHFCRLASYRCT